MTVLDLKWPFLTQNDRFRLKKTTVSTQNDRFWLKMTVKEFRFRGIFESKIVYLNQFHDFWWHNFRIKNLLNHPFWHFFLRLIAIIWIFVDVIFYDWAILNRTSKNKSSSLTSSLVVIWKVLEHPDLELTSPKSSFTSWKKWFSLKNTHFRCQNHHFNI